MIDVQHQVNDVRRTVGSRTFEAGEARVVTVRQDYDAEVDDVWDACTNAERIPRWFLPITGDLRVGGRYDLEGNASGTIEECEPPHRFRSTWEYGGEVSWIEVTVSAVEGGRTRFQLEHLAHVDDERWAEFGPGAVGVGWDLSVMALALHLASGEPVDPGQVQAWTVSEDGRRFMTLSSEAWCAAAIADGDDPQAATAAAARTTAAYAGEPD
jgi:uncharacterized protein YndB with AHSA1/START domain